MKPIASNARIQILGPHPEEAALLARPSRRMAAGVISLAAVLRDARKSALLRTRLMDDIDSAYLSNSAATALTRLREYFGSPALIEFPVLNELFPASTCAGTRLRRMGTLSSSFFFSKRSLSTASATNAVATDFLASAGSGWSTARNLPNCMI